MKYIAILIGLAAVIFGGYYYVTHNATQIPVNIEQAALDTAAQLDANGTSTGSVNTNVTQAILAITTAETMQGTSTIQIGKEKYVIDAVTFSGTDGKQQIKGSFKNVAVKGLFFDKKGLPIAGVLTVAASSIETNNAIANKTILCSSFALDCAKYPNIAFVFKSAEKVNTTDLSITGTVLYKNISHNVTFIAKPNAILSFTADFAVDGNTVKLGTMKLNKDVKVQIALQVRKI